MSRRLDPGRLLILAAVLATAACASRDLPPPAAGPPVGSVIVVARGWHTDIALDADRLTGRLARFARDLPEARAFVFGFGDRHYLLARRVTPLDALQALFPGPGAMLVTALRVPPSQAFGSDNTVALPASGPQLGRIGAFLEASFAWGPEGEAVRLADGPYPGSAYYASPLVYDAFHTCNRWDAEVLQAGGFDIDPIGILFAGQVMSRVRELARRAGPGHAAWSAR